MFEHDYAHDRGRWRRGWWRRSGAGIRGNAVLGLVGRRVLLLTSLRCALMGAGTTGTPYHQTDDDDPEHDQDGGAGCIV